VSTDNYYIYENWQAEGHKARIHYARCPFCNFGEGIHPGAGKDNGKWHGPFETYNKAFNEARNTGGRVSNCKKCNPC